MSNRKHINTFQKCELAYNFISYYEEEARKNKVQGQIFTWNSKRLSRIENSGGLVVK